MAKGMMQTMALLIALGVVATSTAAEERCYRADADSGELEFSGVADGSGFQGDFNEFTVSLCLENDDLSTAVIEVTVATGSATVGNRQGDEALHSDELFHVERFPEAVWTSTSIHTENGEHRAEGELRLRGVEASQPVELSFDWHDDGLKLSGGAEILRMEYDVGQGEFEDTDFVRDRVDLSFELDLSPAD